MASKQYTGNQVAKAGKALLHPDKLLKDDYEFNRVMDVLSFWRLCHEQPLDCAWEVLQEVSKRHDASVILAKRLKRYASIHKKLVRFQEMSLKRMQDIGGVQGNLRE
jgi:ppGpp synthetase/RelA/SpoT-type nucleotidyltranferase